MMRPEDVVQIVHVLENAGIAVWFDGGWGVDALLGQQTRSARGGTNFPSLAERGQGRVELMG